MFEFEQFSTDRDRIRGFVQTVYEFVSAALIAGRWQLFNPNVATAVRLDPGLKEAATAAFKEFTQQPHVHDLLVTIERASNATLEAHGLTGDQLRFKLANVQARERRFRLFPSFRPLRRLIATIDTLLDSIIEVLGVGGALKELKDAAFDATEDDEK